MKIFYRQFFMNTFSMFLESISPLLKRNSNYMAIMYALADMSISIDL